MIEIQLYIDTSSDDSGDYARVDLFEEESVTLISSIQNIKDISKIFADYSRTFKIPANDNNNKLFKHFYNPDVRGFSGSTKKIAKIYLNHMPFREGYVYLQSVDMKNNKAANYTILFYGGLIRIKEAMGEDKLASLKEYLDADLQRFDYENDDVKTGFTTGLYSGDMIYPLITSEKRLYYDSSTASPNYDGNLYHNTSSPDTDRGLAYTDLKPAIKVPKVLEAIESKYNISFTGFLNTTTPTTPLSNLYLWLSRESGEIINYKSEGEEESTKEITGLTTSGSEEDLLIQDDVWTFTQDAWFNTSFNVKRFSSEFTVDISSGSFDTITLKAIDTITGDVIGERTESNVAGQSITLKTTYNYAVTPARVKYQAPRTFGIRWEVSTLGGAATFTSDVVLKKKTGKQNIDSLTYNAFGGATGTTIPEQDITNHLPDIKVLDFLTGLFKMFNLTAYVQEPLAPIPVIEVKTLDDYYDDAVNNVSQGTIDIVDYVDVESHNIEVARPFSVVSFEYKETDIVLMNQHEAEHNEVFGNTSYYANKQFNDLGVEYKIEVPFSHFKYERLYDVGSAVTSRNSNLTDIQWGYSAGGDFKHEDATTQKSTPTGNYSPEKVEPLLFYGIQQTISTGGINWISDASPSSVTTYWRPSNANEEGTDTVAPSSSLNFDTEFDEWQQKDYNEPDSDLEYSDNSLFGKYYLQYILGAYHESKRIFKYKCFFPAKILVSYKLNDQIKIHDRLFRINSIKTNLKTGATELELLNLIPDLDTII